MDCVKSLELLSDFRDDTLGQEVRVQIQIHLIECPPCAGVFIELNLIIVAARELRGEAEVRFPDESVVWQRMKLAKHANPLSSVSVCREKQTATSRMIFEDDILLHPAAR